MIQDGSRGGRGQNDWCVTCNADGEGPLGRVRLPAGEGGGFFPPASGPHRVTNHHLDSIRTSLAELAVASLTGAWPWKISIEGSGDWRHTAGMAMKVLVIGAHGNTGRRVVQRLKEGPHDPWAMIRRAEQRDDFDGLGVATVLGDLEYPIDHAVRGCDAVIFAAGSGPKTGKDKTVLVDHIGAIRSMVAAAVNGAKRYILLSSLNADARSDSKIRHYHRAKGRADDFLRGMHEVMEERLDWTIVCPGGLTGEPGSGRISVSRGVRGKGNTSRENLAAALVACLDLPNTIGKDFALLDGEGALAEELARV